MSKKIWRTYLAEFSDHLSEIAVVLAALLLIGMFLNVLTGNVFFVALNSSLATFTLCSYLLRKRLGAWIVVVAITVSGFALTVASLLLSARLGSAQMVLTITQLIVIFFLSKRQSIAIGTAGILVFLSIGWMFSQGTLVIPQSVIERQTDFFSWIISAFTLIGFNVIAINLVGRMRSRFLNSVNELVVQNENMAQIAFVDPVTGLANKSGFLKRIQEQADQGKYDHGLVMLLGIRKYSLIEALYGITVAEAQLKSMAQILQKYVEGGFIARVNGGEFAIWIPQVAADMLTSVFMDTRLAARALLEAQTPGVPIDIDKSVARFPEDGATIEECLLNAELALHDAFQNGRSIRWFSPGMRESLIYAEDIEHKVEKAISNDEFRFVFQPQVELASSNVVGVEVLARWTNSELGTVNPEDFIPALTRKALISQFTMQCLVSVLAQITKIDSRFGSDTSVSFNISPAALLSDNFVDSALHIINDSSVDPKRVIFEITEDLFIEELGVVEEVIHDLSQNGIRVSLDDFGTGYSSLCHISALPISEIKADKVFVLNIADDQRSFNVFRNMCSMADALGHSFVAEGVENADQLKAIQRTSCRIVQGYLFGRPEAL